jgi:lipoprotein-anchoring transpeptidase ErfK/SrfK
MLAIVPTSLIAETTAAQGQDPSPQTGTTVKPQSNATPNSAKGATSTTPTAKPGTPATPATTATGTTPTAKPGTPATPATTATGTTPTAKSGTSTTPATTATGTTPTAKPGTPATPATAATTTKPASGNTSPTAKPGTAAVTATGSSPTTGNGIDSKAPASAVSTNSPPVMETVSLVLNLKEKHVYVYKGDKVLTKYPVAIGKKGWETPVGEWQVMEKVVNPGWTSFKNGSVLKPGKDNPLGERWIGFWTDGQDVIGFHGTPNVKSIGTAASHGCVRMLNRDVKALFPLVKVGTTVKVVAQ